MNRFRGWALTAVVFSALVIGYQFGAASSPAYAAEFQGCTVPPFTLSPASDGTGFLIDLQPNATVVFPTGGTGNVLPLQGNVTASAGFPLDLGPNVVPVGSPSLPNVMVTFPSGGRVMLPLPSGGKTIHVAGKPIRVIRSR